jgi:hypothetical protein
VRKTFVDDSQLCSLASTSMSNKEKEDALSISAGCLNIAASPHNDPDVYPKLFKAALSSEVKYWGDKLGRLRRFVKRSDGVYEGLLLTYNRVSKSSTWGDTDSGEQLAEDDVEQIPLPPENLGHDFDRHEFIFYPRKHRAIVECNTLDIRQWKSLLGHLLTRAGSRLNVRVEVTIVPMRDTIEKLLQMDRVAELTIKLTRPNPDDLESLEAEMVERLTNQNSKSIEIVLSAAKNESIEPDEETLQLARVAQENGWVRAVGKSKGRRDVRSTKDHPQLQTTTYRGRLVDALRSMANRFLG